MAKPGPARKPALQIVREGNPGHHSAERLAGGVRLKPTPPDEPDWREWFPTSTGDRGRNGEMTRCRKVARDTWRRVVAELAPQGLLSAVDTTVVVDLAIIAARIDQCERDVSRRGLWVQGERGAQKNPSMTALNQLRTQLKFYIGELGLSPAARDGMHPREGDGDGGDPFD